MCGDVVSPVVKVRLWLLSFNNRTLTARALVPKGVLLTDERFVLCEFPVSKHIFWLFAWVVKGHTVTIKQL